MIVKEIMPEEAVVISAMLPLIVRQVLEVLISAAYLDPNLKLYLLLSILVLTSNYA